MTVRTWFDHAKPFVAAAMEHAVTKHGAPTTDPVRGASTLSEECGEVAAEALEATRNNVHPAMKAERLNRMIRELDQVAAYAILLRCSMEGEVRKLRQGTDNEPT